MRSSLDFVPNHTGLDHDWVRSRPELYVEGTLDDYRQSPDLFHPVDAGDAVHFIACGRDPELPAVAGRCAVELLQPRNATTRCAACSERSRSTATAFAATWRCSCSTTSSQGRGSGRVDLLWPVPSDEFWPAAIRRVPSLVYIAEVYWDREWELQQQGFHFTYDKRLLDRLQRASRPEFAPISRPIRPTDDRLVRFLENHDEARSARTFARPLAGRRDDRGESSRACDSSSTGSSTDARRGSPVQLGRWQEETARPGIRDSVRQALERDRS